MKIWPAPSAPAAPRTRRRIPAFHPVPVGKRADGWTPIRQAEFIGWLAQTRSVTEACRRVGMAREGAYRLRARAAAQGPQGFAAAWEAAHPAPQARSLFAETSPETKVSPLSAAYRLEMGLLQVVLKDGRYVGTHWKDDENALLELLGQLNRVRGGEGQGLESHTP